MSKEKRSKAIGNPKKIAKFASRNNGTGMKYPIGLQNFEKVRMNGCVYVDKTALIYQLVTTGCYYFLSRPRRFGKSMLISTIEAYFSGRKELFEGLAIEKLEKDWTKYPVLHLDLNTEKYDAKESLERVLDDTLTKWEQQYGKSPTETSLPLRFLGIVERAAEKTGQRVVILIDGYDEPLLHVAGDQERLKNFSSTLQAFYSVLKTNDRYIRFAFMAGVTEFGRLSMYPDLNNFDNISRDNRYHALCGFTKGECLRVFDKGIKELSQSASLTEEQCAEKFSQFYGGYHYAHGTEELFHPYWTLEALNRKDFAIFQYAGVDSILVQTIKSCSCDNLSSEEMFFSLSSGDSTYWLELPMLLFQYGYLTIADYDREFQGYVLSIPNEVCCCQLFKLGISFSTKTRKIEEWKLDE